MLSAFVVVHKILERGGIDMVITEELLSPITTALTSNLNVLVPVGITIMGIMIGVSLIPRIVYKFL